MCRWACGLAEASILQRFCTTRRESGAPLKTFSISFQGRSFDETAYIREVAQRYQTEHEELDLNPEVNLRDAIEAVCVLLG